MAACKCRYCQSNLLTGNAYKVEKNKKRAYFCNEEHYKLFDAIEEDRKQKEKLAKQLADQKRVEEQVAIEKRKADKDKAYWLICDIVGRKEIISTVLWKEWAIWNKVATNDVIGNYLEENKAYLIGLVSKIDNVEVYRIKYLSAIIKNAIGDYGRREAKTIEKPIVNVDESFYESTGPVNRKRRRALEDLEDDL